MTEPSPGNLARAWPVALLIAAAWVATGVFFVGYPLVGLQISFNLFSWDYDLGLRQLAEQLRDPSILAYYLGFVVAPPSLAVVTRHPLSTFSAWAVALLLLVAGASMLPAEALSPDTLLGRDHASPIWFRAAMFGGFCYPAAVLSTVALTRRLRPTPEPRRLRAVGTA